MAMIAKFVAGQPSGLEAVNSGAASIRDGSSNTFLIRDGTSNIRLIQDGTSNTIMFAGNGDVLAGGDHILSGFPEDNGVIDGGGVLDGAPGGNIVIQGAGAPLDDFLL